MLEDTEISEHILHTEVSRIRVRKAIDLENVLKLLSASNDKVPSAAAMASQLCLSVRTFNRYLRNSGVTFRELQEQTQKQKVQQYMVNREISIGDISKAMGYTDPSNFSKAFKNWFGMTPRDYRNSLAKPSLSIRDSRRVPRNKI